MVSQTLLREKEIVLEKVTTYITKHRKKNDKKIKTTFDIEEVFLYTHKEKSMPRFILDKKL